MPDLSKSISVIIPAYNIEDLLEKCVDSVAAQDYPRELLQIIIVDDGSTDKRNIRMCRSSIRKTADRAVQGMWV